MRFSLSSPVSLPLPVSPPAGFERVPLPVEEGGQRRDTRS